MNAELGMGKLVVILVNFLPLSLPGLDIIPCNHRYERSHLKIAILIPYMIFVLPSEISTTRYIDVDLFSII